MAIVEYGRGTFLVDSHSRTGLRHLVDFEPELDDRGKPALDGEPYRCSCEAFALRLERPCRHCIECLEYLLPILNHIKRWRVPELEPPEEPKKRIYQLKRHVTPIYEKQHRLRSLVHSESA